MNVLVDSSVWMDYFKSGNGSGTLDCLIENNLVYTNDLILTELVPFLRNSNQKTLVDLLNKVFRFPISIDWQEFQNVCLKSGISGVGIPDLIIVQNAK